MRIMTGSGKKMKQQRPRIRKAKKEPDPGEESQKSSSNNHRLGKRRVRVSPRTLYKKVF